jgi:putative membrane protein insertion efficiency factor
MCSHYAGSLPETSECRDRRRLSRDRNLGQTPSAPTGLAAATLLFLILCYRRYVSPYTVPSCRFTPTCSRYAIDAVRRYGALQGSWLAIWRVLRCNPFCRGGYDPLR